MTPQEELTLIEQAQTGSLEAFNQLVLSYQDQVFNLSARMLDDDEAAADAAQAAFLAAFRRLDSFRGGSFRAWLLQIAANLCRDELRRRLRHPLLPLEPVNEDQEEIDTPPWLADDQPSPEQQVERGELARTLERGLLLLPYEFRAALMLVDMEGLDYHEAADVMGVPTGTIKSRVSRGRLRMKAFLEREMSQANEKQSAPARWELTWGGQTA